MSGFSQVLQESAPAALDERSRHYLQRIHEASQRMSSLIEDLLNLSGIGRSELSPRPVSLSQVCAEAAAAVRERYPGRDVRLDIAPDMHVDADPKLLRTAMENLLSNAWKYTAQVSDPTVSVGMTSIDGETVYFVRDDGIGFDLAYSDKLFVPFQRLHAATQFPGSGIGLVTAQRILAVTADLNDPIIAPIDFGFTPRGGRGEAKCPEGVCAPLRMATNSSPSRFFRRLLQ